MIAGCIALLAVLGVCTYGYILKGSDTIFPNVYVAGVNVGGLKREAAVSAVSEAVQKSWPHFFDALRPLGVEVEYAG